MRSTAAAVVWVVAPFISAAPLLALQEDPAPTPPVQAPPVSASEFREVAQRLVDPGVELSELQILVVPMTTTELEPLAEVWTGLLQEKSRAIALLQSQGDEGSEEVVTLQAERDEISKRLGVVLDSLERKGGDVEALRLYDAAVTGMQADQPSAELSYGFVRDWLRSEDGGRAWLGSAVRFVLLILAFWILAGIAGRVVGRMLRKTGYGSELIKQSIIKTARGATLALGVVVALDAVGVDATALVAVLGAAGFAIGFALKDSLSHLAAGVMMLVYRPFDIGDVVEVGDVAGTVESMNLVSTVIRTPDNKKVIVPNSTVWGDVITNATISNRRRVDMTFGIGYQDSMDHAAELLAEIVKAHPLILDDPEPVIRVHELADSSVNLVCRPWCLSEDYWTVHWDVTRAVKERFDAAGISIPYPQRDVHVHGLPADAPKAGPEDVS